jgi:hypothetical protein
MLSCWGPGRRCNCLNAVAWATSGEHVGGSWGILKTDERKVILELKRKGKLTAKSIGWV